MPADPGDHYLAVSGRSGSGKTATIKMIMSWLQAQAAYKDWRFCYVLSNHAMTLAEFCLKVDQVGCCQLLAHQSLLAPHTTSSMDLVLVMHARCRFIESTFACTFAPKTSPILPTTMHVHEFARSVMFSHDACDGIQFAGN